MVLVFADGKILGKPFTRTLLLGAMPDSGYSVTWSTGGTVCFVCGHGLRNPASIDKGVGPVCERHS